MVDNKTNSEAIVTIDIPANYLINIFYTKWEWGILGDVSGLLSTI
jgi:hypothetical protein